MHTHSTAADRQTTTELPSVRGVLNYLSPAETAPVYYLYLRPGETDHRTPAFVEHEVAISDGRSIQHRFSLDEHGFSFETLPSELVDFSDANAVRARYYPEVEELVRRQTDAHRVVAFDHNLRAARPQDRSRHDGRSPVKFVHNDYTRDSARQRVRDLLPDEAERVLGSRFAMINAWRPAQAVVEESPLAVCDARSMTADDFVASELRYERRTGSVSSVRHRERHRWVFFPRMTRDEVLVLRCFDSGQAASSAPSAHTSFDDPRSGVGASFRRSIEVRTIAVFDPLETSRGSTR